MANAMTTIERVEFIIQPELTYCNLYYKSNEPCTPWGGGWKTKTFTDSESAIDILKFHVSEYLLWADGREGVEL